MRSVFDFIIQRHLLRGAVGLFNWAEEQGFIGVGFYLFLWVSIFPAMIIVSNVYGAILFLEEEERQKQWEAEIRLSESDASYKDDMTDYEKDRGF